MSEIPSYGRGQKNPPKVPAKAINAGSYKADDPVPPQKENNDSTTTVDSNVRPIAKPRTVAKPQRSMKDSNEPKIGVRLPCFLEYKAQNASNQNSLVPDEHQDGGVDSKHLMTSVTKTPSTSSSPKIVVEKSPTLTPSGIQTPDKVLYRVPLRTDKPKLSTTKGKPKKYRRLPLPPPFGNAPRKPALPPDIDLEMFSLDSQNFGVKVDDSSANMLDRKGLRYAEPVYEM